MCIYLDKKNTVITLTEIMKYLIINNNKIETRPMITAQWIVLSNVSPTISNSMIETVFKGNNII